MRYFDSNSSNSNFKLVVSGHDTFALRYGWSKKVYDRIHGSDTANVFSKESAIADFGVGKNMLNAMRHWSYYLGFVWRNNKTHSYHNTTSKSSKELDNLLPALNEFYNAQQFFDNHKGLDPYLESPTTLWLMHWALATNPNLITYYWFFNINTKTDLTKDEFARLLKEFIAKCPALEMPSDSTIKKDIDCFILTYSSKKRKANDDAESAIESPLAELGLITRTQQNVIRAMRGQKHNLSLNTVVYCLANFWQRHNIDAGSMSLEMATYDECSIGRVFMLNEETLIEYAEQLEQSDYPLTWTQSAGIRQLQLKNNVTIDDVLEHAIKKLKAEDYQR
ncbi:DUF4007 family protein [Moraxella atlantae]|uniref:DUF4007 domain-containing protein n=1 Tax=Faucicola atlantae TaxID=34059 RepID=A0A378Q290_9GAMM|nr:DUF4007 family protein [Moraxella atlantae]OPH35763.1 hypothetical protein B5J92_04495 [Moraxella atlantae]STY94318.1 Uncharacterised protein [Moraxella atlantae]